MGCGPRQVLSKVILPQALRVMVPPTTSQYLNIIKSSSLGAAVAYPELFQIFAGTAMMQSNREIESIALLMGDVPVDQSRRFGVHELVQPPRRVGGPMSDVVAQRLPMPGGIRPGAPAGRRRALDRVGAAEPVQLASSTPF